jgi:signal transduction histidine kinase
MGSRGRSVRLRIYFLVAIPLITMLGLFGYVAYTSTTTYLNLDRAPNLINATAEPLTSFVNQVQAERRAAVVYLSQPSTASLAAYRGAIATTKAGQLKVTAAFHSVGTRDSTTAAETAGIATMTASLSTLTPLRDQVAARRLSPLSALTGYTTVIAGQGAVLRAEASSISDTAGVEQGLGLISAVSTQEDVSEQDALLGSALVSGSLTAADRVAFGQAVGREQDDTLQYQQLFTPAELKTYNATLNALAPASLQGTLSTVQQAVMAGTQLSEIEQPGLTAGSWQKITGTWLHAASTAGITTADTVLSANRGPAISAKRRLWAVSALGAAGLILTLLVTILVGRSINRRLTLLRRSALTLANEQLPAVVARLRRGEPVDVAAQAPPLLVGNDEIGQVGQAIEAVRQTAIRSAVEEAQVRQGVNDMFRNLARRNQSLLQRQLTALDDMERRATDPDVLEDLFKMDHLTTRMRRHAEGLIILSGAAPGRSWSAPVKLIDVMRGAVSEVEDYARVTVSSQSRAALSGSAVTDVIHLLAELIENSTTLSPPFTQVRVGGESVAHGFAIEIEDRGLGMSPQRLAELNERLANPPELNPANTEQLGLFVVGQLGRRHGITVTLRPSPYGGTTAVVLLPRALIVDEGPAAIAGGSGAAAGGHATNGARTDADAFVTGNFGAGNFGAGNFGGMVRLPATPARGNDLRGLNGWSKSKGWSGPGRSPDEGAPNGANESADTEAFGAAYSDSSSTGSTGSIRISGALRHPGTMPSGLGSTGGFAGANRAPSAPGLSPSGPRRAPRYGTGEVPVIPVIPVIPGEVPVVTGVPVSRPADSLRAPFDVFTPIPRDERDGAQPASPAGNPYPQSYPDFGGHAPAASPPAAPQAGAPQPGPASDLGNGDLGSNGTADGGDSGEDHTGLPRRVRQASLAPELRSSASTAAAASGATGVPRASAESLTVMRNTLSAMQRGWQQGRSQPQGDTEGNVNGD